MIIGASITNCYVARSTGGLKCTLRVANGEGAHKRVTAKRKSSATPGSSSGFPNSRNRGPGFLPGEKVQREEGHEVVKIYLKMSPPTSNPRGYGRSVEAAKPMKNNIRS